MRNTLLLLLVFVFGACSIRGWDEDLRDRAPVDVFSKPDEFQMTGFGRQLATGTVDALFDDGTGVDVTQTVSRLVVGGSARDPIGLHTVWDYDFQLDPTLGYRPDFILDMCDVETNPDGSPRCAEIPAGGIAFVGQWNFAGRQYFSCMAAHAREYMPISQHQALRVKCERAANNTDPDTVELQGPDASTGAGASLVAVPPEVNAGEIRLITGADSANTFYAYSESAGSAMELAPPPDSPTFSPADDLFGVHLAAHALPDGAFGAVGRPMVLAAAVPKSPALGTDNLTGRVVVYALGLFGGMTTPSLRTLGCVDEIIVGAQDLSTEGGGIHLADLDGDGTPELYLGGRRRISGMRDSDPGAVFEHFVQRTDLAGVDGAAGCGADADASDDPPSQELLCFGDESVPCLSTFTSDTGFESSTASEFGAAIGSGDVTTTGFWI